MLSSKDLRQKFLDFHKSKGHTIIPSAPLVPKEDPTVLFNTAGMQPIIPYLLGLAFHPGGDMLANSQICIRTDDIDEVSDNRHLTFFEMLGNWAIGGAYFKPEIISWSMEFMTSKDWLGLDPNRIFVTVYKGNERRSTFACTNGFGDTSASSSSVSLLPPADERPGTAGNSVAADQEAIEYWQAEYTKLGMVAEVSEEFDFKNAIGKTTNDKYITRIRKMSGKDNWWGLPYRGPCGPCSEMYYLLPNNPLDFETSLFPTMTLNEIEDFLENQVVELGNNVFMQYIGERDSNKEPINLEKMDKPNIDTGLGFERFLAAINGKNNVYETDLFEPILAVVEKYSKK